VNTSHVDILKSIQTKYLSRITSLELVVSEKCQNNCRYCYRVKHHNNSTVNYISLDRVKVLVNNLKDMFDLPDDFFHKRRLELFGGDALLDYAKLNDLLKYLNEKLQFNNCMIPTNARMAQELTTYDLEKILNIAPGKIHLSLSVDGDPQDNQRPLSKYGRMLGYQEKINYEKLIKIAKKYRCGFHPMLSFDTPHTWFDTFKFFLDQDVVPYLLEIRHAISKEYAIECVKQLVLIRKYIEKNLKPQLKRFANTVCFSIVPRGLGCSAHTTLTIMPNGDIPFCHRVIDPPWIMANVLTKENNISKLITLTSGHDHRNHPICIACKIKKICAGQCAGASYEYWGDPWIPIDSICNYTKLKTFIMSYYFEDWKNCKNYITDGFTFEDLRNEVYEIFGEKAIKSLLEL